MPEIRYSDGSIRQGQELSPDQVPALGLDGARLTYFRIDHATRLQFDDVEVVIETPFRLTVAEGVFTLDEREELGPVLALYPASLSSAKVASDLALHLAFEGGAEIVVPQDPNYESWHVIGPGQREIHCPPAGNGTLAVFA